MDGGSARQLTDDKEWDLLAPWLPDGRRLVFTSGRQDTVGVWTIGSDGTGLRRLLDAAASPLTSPDGSHVYVLGRYSRMRRIWRIPLEAGPAEVVADLRDSPVGLLCLVGVSDQWVYFTGSEKQDADIWVMNLE